MATAKKPAAAQKPMAKPEIARKTGKTGASKSILVKPRASAASQKPLSSLQQAFILEYLKDLNGARAAIRAGYSPKSAQEQSSRLLSNIKVKAVLQEAIKAREQRVEMTADRVLLELRRLAFFDIRKIFKDDGTLKRVIDLDDDTAAAIMSVEMVEIGTDGQLSISKKFKASDKKGALELAMRHMGMLNDKLQLTMPTAIIKDLTGRKD